MRFDNERFPALKMLERGTILPVGIPSCDKGDFEDMESCEKKIFNALNAEIPSFKTSIKYITAPLWDAMYSSWDKLMKPDLLSEVKEYSGTFLFGKEAVCVHYKLSADEHPLDRVNLLWFYDGILIGVRHYDEDKTWTWESKSIDGKFGHEYGDAVSDCFKNTLGMVMFLKYAEIETKILAPNKQHVQGPNCIYSNRSKHEVEVIDSTWFTTLIKSDAFKVRGHFRLQPFGERLSKRKLVWINDFEKNGYHRTAKKAYGEAKISV